LTGSLDPAPLTMKDISNMQGICVCVCLFVCVPVVISLKPRFGFQNKTISSREIGH